MDKWKKYDTKYTYKYRTTASTKQVDSIPEWLNSGLRNILLDLIERYHQSHVEVLSDDEHIRLWDDTVALSTVGLFCMDGNPFELDVSVQYSIGQNVRS
jgi:hypothetical protein